MAFSEAVRYITLPIGAAIASNVFCKINSSGQAVVCANNDDAVGITAEAVTTAEYDSGNGQTTVQVALPGCKYPIRMKASTAAVIGGIVTTDAGGEGFQGVTGDRELGYYLETADVDAAQDVVTILFVKGGHLIA